MDKETYIMLSNTVDEEWKCIPNNVYPDIKQQYYYISTFGRISNGEIILSTAINNNGYECLTLATTYGLNKMTLIHRIVLMSFGYIEGCEYLDVNHKDGNKLHNWLCNLEWTTRKENMEHAYNIGLCGYGEQSANNKITLEQTQAICSLLDHGVKPINILNHMNLPFKDYRGIWPIQHGISWTDEVIKYDFFRKDVEKKLTQDQINKVIELYMLTNYTPIQILNAIGIQYDSLSNNNKRMYLAILFKIIYDI